jgi:curved DNA-binding protein CbpA
MPSDHFATLNQPRRPWLDPEELKQIFHRRTAEQHPDKKGDTTAFAEMNSAYSVLKDPVSRLRHLLELEASETLEAGAELPQKLTDAFMRVATLRQAIDAFIKEQSLATTPLAQALLASARFTLQRDVKLELATLDEAYAQGLEAIKAADAEWDTRRDELQALLWELQQELTYVVKWSAQLREALFQLGTEG